MVRVSVRVSVRAYYILMDQEEVEFGVKLGKRNETYWKHRDLVRHTVLFRDRTAAKTGVHSGLAVAITPLTMRLGCAAI